MIRCRVLKGISWGMDVYYCKPARRFPHNLKINGLSKIVCEIVVMKSSIANVLLAKQVE